MISLGKAGQIELSPGTRVNLTFTDNAVTADLTEGRLRITSASDANFSIKTTDGIIANDKSRNTVFVTEIIGGATGVNTETGIALVNGAPVRAGEVWTSDPKLKSKFLAKSGRQTKTKRSSGKTFLRYALFGAAGAGIGVLIGLAVRD